MARFIVDPDGNVTDTSPAPPPPVSTAPSLADIRVPANEVDVLRLIQLLILLTMAITAMCVD